MKRPLLERLHKKIFGFDADVQVYGWRWVPYQSVSELSSEGDYVQVTQAWLCFQRRFTV